MQLTDILSHFVCETCTAVGCTQRKQAHIALPTACVPHALHAQHNSNTDRSEHARVQNEIERVNLEVQAAERDYDLNRAAELKYGTLLQLQKQLREAEDMLEREMVRCPAACPSRNSLQENVSEHCRVWTMLLLSLGGMAE